MGSPWRPPPFRGSREAPQCGGRGPLPCNAKPSKAKPNQATPSQAMPRSAMPCHATLCHATSCHATPRHAMACHGRPWHRMAWQGRAWHGMWWWGGVWGMEGWGGPFARPTSRCPCHIDTDRCRCHTHTGPSKYRDIYVNHPVVKQATAEGVPWWRLRPCAMYTDGVQFNKKQAFVALYIHDLYSDTKFLVWIVRA